MALVNTAELVEEASGGIAAFNVITIAHAEAIVAGAAKADRPAILQISENAIKFHNGQIGPISAAVVAIAEASEAPVAMHLDHVTDQSLWEVAPQHGYGSVMIDASKLDYDENVAETARAVDWLNSRGLWVESELGQIGGKHGQAPLSAHDPAARTDPRDAAAYVSETGVDALAVAVGSSHAMTTRDAKLDHALIAEIKASAAVPLVLHGSSGVSDAELVQAVRSGMVKINIGTALNVAYTAAVREHMEADPNNVDPRGYLTDAREAMTDTVAHFLTVLKA